MSTLNAAIVQADLLWHDAPGNRAKLAAALGDVDNDCDLIVLPEMFATGFSMAAESLAEPMEGESVQWLRELAATRQCTIGGSLIIRDGDKFYNRFIAFDANGKQTTYDKRHLFAYAGVDEHYAAGNRIVTFNVNGFRVCPMICYDLRFPVWSRIQPEHGYDVLLYTANWPAKRHHAWRTLLRARAIENQCYVVAVNRVGKDGNGHAYQGGSAIIDYLGHDLVDLGDKEGVANRSLDLAALNDCREKLAFQNDADRFEIKDSLGS